MHLFEVSHHPRHHVGVGVEDSLHVGEVSVGVRRIGDLGRHVVPVSVAEPCVVTDVAGRLLQVGGEPAPFQDLGQEVRGLLAGEMSATELGDGVVPIVEEDALI